MLAVEVCMKRLAEHFGEETETWARAGLLHDIDYDQTKDDFSKHGIIAAEILKERGCSDAVISAVKAHALKKEIENRMEGALYAVDPLTGLIAAAALMRPDRKIASADTAFILRRFSESRFAAGANRDQIRTCEKIGLPLEKFIELSLEAMKQIASDLGL